VKYLGEDMNDIVIYKDGSVALDVTVEHETVWLNQKQMSELFAKSVKTINEHIGNIYAEGELDKYATVRKFRIVQTEGKREVEREIDYYSLDVTISVGYRVKSKQGTQFRIWATSILKQHLLKGYTLDQKRLDVLEEKQLLTDKKLQTVLQAIEDKSLKPKQGIFYDGEVFDAYVFVADLIKSVKESIVLIDNYVDESVLTLFSKNPSIEVTIYTKSISKQLKLDLKKYNTQHKPISIKTFKESHDRFLILDGKEVYHFGASLKDLGKKWFAFSKFELEVLGMLERLGYDSKEIKKSD